MKRIALLAVIGAALLAPSSASAQSGADNCPDGVQTSPNICVYESTTGFGGEIVLNNSDGCSYVNGWDTNPVAGYAGRCANATTSPTCNGTNSGAGANTGGCFWIKDGPDEVNEALNSGDVGDVTATFICGNTSGEDPQDSTRDGCFIP